MKERATNVAHWSTPSTILKNWGLTGGILHVDGKIAAFTFGMPINQDTFGVHVEKADTSIDGAYAMINYEFCQPYPRTICLPQP